MTVQAREFLPPMWEAQPRSAVASIWEVAQQMGALSLLLTFKLNFKNERVNKTLTGQLTL